MAVNTVKPTEAGIPAGTICVGRSPGSVSELKRDERGRLSHILQGEC